MTDQPTPPTITQEAPASWTTSYQDPSGFTCEITLRAPTGAELLKKAGAALKVLVDSGCSPVRTPTTLASEIPPSKIHDAPKLPDGSPDPTWCAVHGVAMARHEKNGETWFSHKIDGGYCRGKALP